MTDTMTSTDPGFLIDSRVSDVTPTQAAVGQRTRTQPMSELFKHVSTKAVHEQWVNDPITQAYISTLRELSYLPYSKGILPVEGNAYIQYGMTLAFQFAERLITNPESVIPAFHAPDPGDATREPVVVANYSDAPDDII